MRGRSQESKSLPPRGRILIGLALVFVAGALFGLWRAGANLREYRQLRASDPSGAELYLDGAWIWGVPSFLALASGALCAWVATRRR